jgi:hypothetical protein
MHDVHGSPHNSKVLNCMPFWVAWWNLMPSHLGCESFLSPITNIPINIWSTDFLKRDKGTSM